MQIIFELVCPKSTSRCNKIFKSRILFYDNSLDKDMSKIIAFALFVTMSLFFTIVYPTVVLPVLESNNMLKKVVYTLEEVNNGAYFAKLVDVPLLICGVKVDLAVKLSTFIEVVCELTLGKNVFQFCLNDLSVMFHIEEKDLQLEGEVSKYGFSSFKAIVNTDGIIEGVPKLVLYYL